MSKQVGFNVVGIGPTWLDRRQMGFKNPLGTRCHIYEQMYSSILPCGCWNQTLNNSYTSVHGGVFSLEFSPEGSLLVAACEKRSVLLFDPLTHKRIHSVENAHLDCVNCVRFLDSRSFATCSDDFTVALWDARNLNQKVRSLKGHSNWVKNIEYSPQDGLLVTSGFDGSILTWEMNKYKEDGTICNKVFSTNGLMRTCLTPDATKMVICTTGGYLIIIHNLDLNTLGQDLEGFKPNMYRLMQLSQTILPIASDFTHLFQGQGKRNKVEFITDFPDGDEAEVVASLQIHPDGHSAISRNVSNNEKSEWSCIHNIEERCSSDESDCTDDEVEDFENCKSVSWPGTTSCISTTPSYIIQHTVAQNERTDSGSINDAGTSSEQRDLSVSPSDVWEALVAIQEARIRRETDRMASEMSVGHMFRRHALNAGTQVRPLHSDSQILVTRIFSNGDGNSDMEERHQSLVSSAPVLRRNVSVNTTEINGRSSMDSRWLSRRNSGFRLRKKLPVRSRYTSLYRRSLVGQYDRTSIMRKPIYNSRINRLKLRIFNEDFRLNTNYEMNETQRLQSEFEPSRAVENLNDFERPSNDQPGSSGLSARKGRRSGMHRRIDPSFRKSMPRMGRESRAVAVSSSSVNTAINSLTQDLTSLENNLNSLRESLPNLEGTINSTCSALRRGESILQAINDLIGGEEILDGEIENGSDNNNGEGASSANTSRSEERNESADVDFQGDPPRGEVSEEAARNAAVNSASSSEGIILAPTDGSASNSERTILMGVFRAGNEDGIRGTSMRRHNIAAVTVSSPSQIMPNSVVGRYSVDRNRTGRDQKSSNNIKNDAPAKRYPVVPVNKKIHQNTRRLTHYVEEPNLGRGFIKELCVSPDGRIICSPFGNGIRLLSFSPRVQDVFHCYPRSPPIPLHELTLNIAHTDIVVSTKFSPFHNLLVSGCLSGKIVYYQPFL